MPKSPKKKRKKDGPPENRLANGNWPSGQAPLTGPPTGGWQRPLAKQGAGGDSSTRHSVDCPGASEREPDRRYAANDAIDTRY